MRSLIVGMGEVGQALALILERQYPVYTFDKNAFNFDEIKNIEILHICFPYSEEFISQVQSYQATYKPKYTVIHSTVPVGTSSKLNALHSPIRGLHPNLERGIRTFVKFIGGKQASFVADYFRRAGIKVALFDKPETTEAMKLFDTQYYLECVRFCKKVKEFCDEGGLSFHEVYTLANQTYNEGYTKLGFPEYVRPVLQPIMTEVGGHCLLPNEKLLHGK